MRGAGGGVRFAGGGLRGDGGGVNWRWVEGERERGAEMRCGEGGIREQG